MFERIEDSVFVQSPCTIEWAVNNVGFGQFRFYEHNGKMWCDNESMSKDFIKEVLCSMVDQCELTD